MGIRIASASITRPADTTAYASGDLIANSTTAGSVTPLEFVSLAENPGGSVAINRMRLRKSGTSVTTCSIRIHLFTASPTVANGDNAAFSANKSANWLGSFDVTVTQAFTDGAAVVVFPTLPVLIRMDPGVGSIYGLLEARSAYTPANAETFTVTLEAEAA